MAVRWKILSKWAMAVGLLFSASSFACGDYCDSGWAGVYETGGYDFYQSATDIYNTTLEVDVTTTTYAPVYDTSSYGGSCGSLISTCGGGYDNPGLLNPLGSGSGMPGDVGLIPRDPTNPYNPTNPINNLINPFNPGMPPIGGINPMNPVPPVLPPGTYVDPITGQILPIPPNAGMIPRDPAVLPPIFPPQPPVMPIGMNPPYPPMPPYRIPRNPYLPPVVTPPANPVPVVPTGVGTSTLPNTGTIGRDPNTPYLPPPPPPHGGCDNVVVMCPTGGVIRPTGNSGSTPGVSTFLPGNTIPTVSTPNVTPSTLAPGTAPYHNQIPRGARQTH